MTYPRTLHLTEDGVDIVVQRPTARAVATAARAAVGELTIADGRELFDVSRDDDPESTPQAVILAWWIARSLDLADAAAAEARRLAGRKGVPR